jgi:hypothetical protein
MNLLKDQELRLRFVIDFLKIEKQKLQFDISELKKHLCL